MVLIVSRLPTASSSINFNHYTAYASSPTLAYFSSSTFLLAFFYFPIDHFIAYFSTNNSSLNKRICHHLQKLFISHKISQQAPWDKRNICTRFSNVKIWLLCSLIMPFCFCHSYNFLECTDPETGDKISNGEVSNTTNLCETR